VTHGSSVTFSVVIAGGGTGGHLYPGVAVARELLARRPDAQITFAGTARGIESRVVPREGFTLDLVRSGGLKGKSVVDRLRGLLLVPVSLIDAWRASSPDAVLTSSSVSGGSARARSC
jgi:UDP-N-acetylglucosamine--N-acetylmuramyl-(pentapeptide) pyrophosphoryl-undecaprenol N-acetylglucosamine transferase